MNIGVVGSIYVPDEVVAHADSIKLENYKVNTPAKYQKHEGANESIRQQLSVLTGFPVERVQWVYFSACDGAEPHTDDALVSKFEDTTFVVPLILPRGGAKLRVGDNWHPLRDGFVYKFDHTVEHEMTVGDNGGCVVLMAAILREANNVSEH